MKPGPVKTDGAPGDVEAVAGAVFREEGCSAPSRWSNAAGDRYGTHDHPYHKVLFCLQGSIVFHAEGDDLPLREGDRLDLPAGTPHAATVGPDGCACVEARRP